MSVPSLELGPPYPLSRKRMCPPPRNQRGGGVQTRLRVGESKSDDWRESLVLCLHCALNPSRVLKPLSVWFPDFFEISRITYKLTFKYSIHEIYCNNKYIYLNLEPLLQTQDQTYKNVLAIIWGCFYMKRPESKPF